MEEECGSTVERSKDNTGKNFVKKVAITARLIENDTYAEKREALDVRWGGLFNELNFIPIVLGINFDFKKVFSEIGVDGIILSGGNDVSAVSNDPNSKLRDDFEIAIIEHALKNNIPVLGVCRGMQLMAHHFGGKITTVKDHTGSRHSIQATKGSKFYKELNDHKQVNSFHNYAVAEVPVDFVVSATAAGGTIEAMEHSKKQALGIMWHPERNEPFDNSDLSLIRKFFDA